jgi:hypothetical protein
MKFEKVTLWMYTEDYGGNSDVGALDYIVEMLENLDVECKLLGYETEDYKIVPAAENVMARRG